MYNMPFRLSGVNPKFMVTPNVSRRAGVCPLGKSYTSAFQNCIKDTRAEARS